MSWGLVMVLSEFNVAVAKKGEAIYTAPLDSEGNFSFDDLKEIKSSYLCRPSFIKEVNKIFGTSLPYGGLWKPTIPLGEYNPHNKKRSTV